MEDDERVLILTPDQVEVFEMLGDVMFQILAPKSETGLHVGLCLRMTPDEARRTARLIDKKADEAEASQRPI